MKMREPRNTRTTRTNTWLPFRVFRVFRGYFPFACFAYFAVILSAFPQPAPKRAKTYAINAELKNPHGIISTAPKTNVLLTVPAGGYLWEVIPGSSNAIPGALIIKADAATNLNLAVDKSRPAQFYRVTTGAVFTAGQFLPDISNWKFPPMSDAQWGAMWRTLTTEAIGFDPAVCCMSQ